MSCNCNSSHNNCIAPTSVTTIINNTGSVPATADLVVSAGLTVTLPSLAVENGIILLLLDLVNQVEGVNFTLDFNTGIIQLVGAVAGQSVHVKYVES